MAKQKNYGSGRDMVWVLLLAVGIFMGYLMFSEKAGTVDPFEDVDIGTDFPAYVDENGYCVGREGIEMGMCCAVWDPEQQKEVWVLCELLVAKGGKWYD